MQEELTVKGIIISTAPQGEYGRRINLLTDRLGRITVFASGAAKAKSHLIGLLRPMTSASFRLAKGRTAWNLRGAELIDSFEALALDVEASVYAAYILETADFFSESGMPETEAKALLNLIYVSFKALENAVLPKDFIRRIYELRLLKLQGEYTERPGFGEEQLAAGLWRHTLYASLTALYDPEKLAEACGIKPEEDGETSAEEGREPSAEESREISAKDRKELSAEGRPKPDGEVQNAAQEAFSENVKALFLRQVPKHFRSLDILREMG